MKNYPLKSDREWASRLTALLERIRSRIPASITPEEIEEDVTVARQEYREARQALRELSGDQLLTTTEAATLLGIRSVNTLKLLCRRGDIRYVTRGNRIMIPLSEIECVQESEGVRTARALERRHEAIADLGGPNELSAEELDDLQASRLGTLPWQR